MGAVIQLVLFLVLAAAIVVLGTFYAERDDARAFAAIPRRLVVFVGGCAAVAVVMLACVHLFAGV
jgi:flagellar motor component MotA